LCCLAGDAEPGRDLGPWAPSYPEPDHSLADHLVQLSSEPSHVGQGVDVSRRHSSGAYPYGASDEQGVLQVLPPGRMGNVAVLVGGDAVAQQGQRAPVFLPSGRQRLNRA
jgi:hypothetical protein